MHQTGLFIGLAAAARLHATSLEIPYVRAGRDFAVRILRRDPHFQVVGFTRAKAHVAGAQQHLAIRQAEQLQHSLRMAGHLFQRLHGVFRTHDLYHFHFIELVHTDKTAGVTTIRARFRAEARRMRGHFYRQRVLVDDFIAHEVGQRHFRRRDQRVVAAVRFFFQRTGMEQIACELRQLTGAIKRVVVHQVRHIVFAIAMLFGMQIEHELRQRAVQTGNLPFHHDKTGAGQLNGAREIKPAMHFTEGDMIAHVEIELTRRAPAAHFHVVAVIFTVRHFIVRQVRDSQRDIADFRQQRIELIFRCIEFFAKLVHFQTKRLDILPTRFRLADGFRSRVTFSLQIFSFYLQNFTTLFKSDQLIYIQLKAPACQFFCDCVWLGTQQIGIEHAYPVLIEKRKGKGDRTCGRTDIQRFTLPQRSH
ncbi:hypothetical protein BN133_99 [Cronobacter dublinensis 582]|nr:hypothetical protein BN133_99 [Cronobacter dublinensis 582]